MASSTPCQDTLSSWVQAQDDVIDSEQRFEAIDQMKAGLGIDFGTTNSTVCLFDGTNYHYANLGDGRRTIPSLLYVDKRYHPTYGELARSQFLSDNLNRRIELEKTDLGYIQITMGDDAFESFGRSVPTTFDAKISALTDRKLPGFLFASTKRLLGQTTMESVKVFDKNMKLEAVVSSIVQNIQKAVKRGFPHLASAHVCVGRPVNYECEPNHDQDECNSLGLARMTRALDYAEVGDFSFFLEPIAPVLSYVHENDEERNQRILVLDFGGGTLDFSLVRKADRRLEVVGSFGRALGGDVITEQLLKDHVFPRIGLSNENLITLRRRHNYLGDISPNILNWRTTYALNQPQYFMQIAKAMRLLPQEAERLNRIRLLIVQNFSYNVFHAVDTAKRKLSNSLRT